MDQFKKSTSLSILRKMHFFSKQLFSHYLKMEKCPKTMEGLFQSSRVIRIGGPYFPIRTCMQNFSQILRVQFEKSPKLFFEGRVSFMPKPAGAPTPPPKRALNAYGARPLKYNFGRNQKCCTGFSNLYPFAKVRHARTGKDLNKSYQTFPVRFFNGYFGFNY